MGWVEGWSTYSLCGHSQLMFEVEFGCENLWSGVDSYLFLGKWEFHFIGKKVIPMVKTSFGAPHFNF